MATTHVITRDDINLEQLATEIGQQLGQPVVLTARSRRDGGHDLTVSSELGEVLDVDPQVVDERVAAHVATIPRRAEDDLVDALDAATTLPQLRAALLAWARAQRDRNPRTPPRLSLPEELRRLRGE